MLLLQTAERSRPVQPRKESRLARSRSASKLSQPQKRRRRLQREAVRRSQIASASVLSSLGVNTKDSADGLEISAGTGAEDVPVPPNLDQRLVVLETMVREIYFYVLGSPAELKVKPGSDDGPDADPPIESTLCSKDDTNFSAPSSSTPEYKTEPSSGVSERQNERLSFLEDQVIALKQNSISVTSVATAVDITVRPLAMCVDGLGKAVPALEDKKANRRELVDMRTTTRRQLFNISERIGFHNHDPRLPRGPLHADYELYDSDDYLVEEEEQEEEEGRKKKKTKKKDNKKKTEGSSSASYGH